jgi:cellulose synthase/poly-beta-1,6-N-acetylglucosamine synthase-like glycosyltransferase/exo-beta-1,3-glucanase (GH17 family)
MRPSMRLSMLCMMVVAAVAAGLVWRVANEPVMAPDGPPVLHGVSYTPYVADPAKVPSDAPPFNEDAVQVELDIIAQRFGRLRTYGASGAQGQTLALASRHGLKVSQGVWIGVNRHDNDREIEALTDLMRGGIQAERIIVGNEAILRSDLSVTELTASIARVQKMTNIPVGSAEPWHVWLANPALADAVDFIGVQILPYWEGLPVEAAPAYVMARLDEVRLAYPGKPVVVTEIGWPRHGRRIGGAIASRVNQTRFLRAATAQLENAQIPYFVIEAFDRPWKIATEGLAGGYWGLWDAAGAEKYSSRGAVLERPAWRWWALASVLLGLFVSCALGAAQARASASLLLSILAQGTVFAAVWSLMAAAAVYASGFEIVVWGVLIAAQWFLLLVLLIDGLEMTDRLWNRPSAERAETASKLQQYPKISIHVPCCQEPPAMVSETLQALSRLDYPNFEVIVVDNNTPDPELWRPLAAVCADLGGRFKFHHLESLEGFKAGALNFAASVSAPDAEYFAVIDSDYVVDPNWLKAVMPEFDDPKVGFVQAPQDYRDGAESIFKRMCFREYATFFQIGMVRRDWYNAIIQHGVMTVIRRGALADAGGWSEHCITEDAELGLRLHARGWKSRYVNKSFGRGLTPHDLWSYKAQRRRWVYGAMRILLQHWRLFLKPRGLTGAQQFQYLAGWAPWIADAVGLVFTIGAVGWTFVLVSGTTASVPDSTAFPPWMFPASAIAVFLLRQIRDHILYAHCGPPGFRGRLGAALAGLALSYTVAKAVFAGLLTKNSPFLRTPKDTTDTRPGLAASVGEEAVILICLAVAIGVSIGWFDLNDPAARCWLGMLFVQTAPYAAAVVLAFLDAYGGSAKRLSESFVK